MATTAVAGACLQPDESFARAAEMLRRWNVDGWTPVQMARAYRMSEAEVMGFIRSAVRRRQADPRGFDDLVQAQDGRMVPDGLPGYAQHNQHVDAVMAQGGFAAFSEGPGGIISLPLVRPAPRLAPPAAEHVEAPAAAPAAEPAPKSPITRQRTHVHRWKRGSVEQRIRDAIIAKDPSRPLSFGQILALTPNERRGSIRRAVSSLVHRGILENVGQHKAALYRATAKARGPDA